uniref:Uncharacterized protein n=1 Tax=Arundo donax TaxID=35708 RepID=A0A0A9GRS6_ARUDO
MEEFEKRLMEKLAALELKISAVNEVKTHLVDLDRKLVTTSNRLD